MCLGALLTSLLQSLKFSMLIRNPHVMHSKAHKQLNLQVQNIFNIQPKFASTIMMISQKSDGLIHAFPSLTAKCEVEVAIYLPLPLNARNYFIA